MNFDELAKEWDNNEKNLIRAKSIGDEIKRLLDDKKELRAMDFGCGNRSCFILSKRLFLRYIIS